MAVAETPAQRSGPESKGLRRYATAGLASFDEEALRNAVIHAAGNGLLIVAQSSGLSMKQQTEAVQRSATDVDDIFRRLSQVVDRVQSIDAVVGTVACGAQESARELQNVHDKVRGVAVQFQRLTEPASAANDQIRQTLARVGQAIDDLSENLKCSVEKIRRSVETIHVARQSAGHVETETARFHEQLHGLLKRIGELADSSARVKSDVQEVNTIGATFAYLLEMMAMQGAFQEAIDPLARLFPLVRASTFYDPHRFTANEDECLLTDEEIVISATDPSGVITFANDRFYEIAEYEPGELIGKPHNVIRHPDMPKTAFIDLWAVIQAGKTWQGYVLNRSRLGRVYWLKANVFPCFENGQIVGYIAIRTKPDRQKVRQAIEVYRRVP
jgi:PAS domain S-box-containing protein